MFIFVDVYVVVVFFVYGIVMFYGILFFLVCVLGVVDLVMVNVSMCYMWIRK